MTKTTDSIVVTEIQTLWGWQRIHFKITIEKELGNRKPNSCARFSVINTANQQWCVTRLYSWALVVLCIHQ